jgi:peroxiredoxin
MINKTDKMKISLWVVLILSLGVVSAGTVYDRALINMAGDYQVPGGYQVGDAVAGFRLRNVDGNFVALNDFLNSKGVIVVFTSNHCPFAKAYEDRIIALNAKFAAQGFPVIAINPTDPGTHQDDTFEKMKERSTAKSYGYPYLVDDTQQTAKAFGAGRTPQVYVLQKSGTKFTVRYMGMIDDNPQDPTGVAKFYADEAVSNLLNGKPVVTTITKPVGCAIKWKK